MRNSDKVAEKDRRLADALRENLKKRKSRIRALEEKARDLSDGAPAPKPVDGILPPA